MKSIKAGLNAWLKAQSAIAAIVSTRIYLGTLPQKPTYPALVYDLVSDVSLGHSHDGLVGPRAARFQIDGYATNVAAVETLMETVYAALAGYRGEMGDFLVDGAFDYGAGPDERFKDEATLRNVEGRSRDFRIHYRDGDSSP